MQAKVNRRTFIQAEAAGVDKRIEWEGPAMRCTNQPELNRLMATEPRDGWRI